MTARETGKHRSTIKKSCEKFKETKIVQRFLYFEDLTLDIYRKYYKLSFADLDRLKA
jgi:hypothetical protein